MFEALYLASVKDLAPTRTSLSDIDPNSPFRKALKELLDKSKANTSVPVNMSVPQSKRRKDGATKKRNAKAEE